jgi:hypothetical protein
VRLVLRPAPRGHSLARAGVVPERVVALLPGRGPVMRQAEFLVPLPPTFRFSAPPQPVSPGTVSMAQRVPRMLEESPPAPLLWRVRVVPGRRLSGVARKLASELRGSVPPVPAMDQAKDRVWPQAPG